MIGKWEKWFAWYPVVTQEDEWAWLQTVNRKLITEYNEFGTRIFTVVYEKVVK